MYEGHVVTPDDIQDEFDRVHQSNFRTRESLGWLTFVCIANLIATLILTWMHWRVS